MYTMDRRGGGAKNRSLGRTGADLWGKKRAESPKNQFFGLISNNFENIQAKATLFAGSRGIFSYKFRFFYIYGFWNPKWQEQSYKSIYGEKSKIDHPYPVCMLYLGFGAGVVPSFTQWAGNQPFKWKT